MQHSQIQHNPNKSIYFYKNKCISLNLHNGTIDVNIIDDPKAYWVNSNSLKYWGGVISSIKIGSNFIYEPSLIISTSYYYSIVPKSTI